LGFTRVAGPLLQMLQVEDVSIRQLLVKTLRKKKGQESTRALAHLAVFDLAPAVRRSALKALATHKASEARPVFLHALRHPWTVAAEHAALALVALNDTKAVPDLKRLQRQPRNPTRLRELVKVNHLRNCLLCHPAATDIEGARFATAIPTPGKP